MRLISGLFFVILASTACGGGISEPLAEPKAFLRIVEALEKSGKDSLVSCKPEDEGGYTYHLRSANLLGTVSRGQETFYLAEAAYIRSRNPGSDTPPARGHSFLVALRSDFTVATFCRDFEGGCHLDGNLLKNGEKVMVDFGKSPVDVRFYGYSQIGLPYFFADRINDQQWADEDFIKKEAAKE